MLDYPILQYQKKVLSRVLELKLNLKLKAFDWMFIKIILLQKFNGVFAKNIFTIYRRYNHNVINNNKNIKILYQVINEKIKHYQFFKKKFINYNNYISDLQNLKLNLKKNIYFRNLYFKKFKKFNNYWWELP